MRSFILYSLFVIAIVCSGSVSPIPMAHASNVNYVPLAPIDVNGSEFKTGQECKAPTCFPRYLRTIYNVGVAIAGLFAVFAIVRGGFTLLFTDSILGHSEGKGQILRALGGLVIVYGSYIFMNQINPALGRDLDLSLSFPRITNNKDTSVLSVVSVYTEAELKAREDEGKFIGGLRRGVDAIDVQADKESKRLTDAAIAAGVDPSKPETLASENINTPEKRAALAGLETAKLLTGRAAAEREVAKAIGAITPIVNDAIRISKDHSLTFNQRVGKLTKIQKEIYTGAMRTASDLHKKGFIKESEAVLTEAAKARGTTQTAIEEIEKIQSLQIDAPAV